MLLITNVFLSMITKTRLDGLSKHGSAHASIYSKITELPSRIPSSVSQNYLYFIYCLALIELYVEKKDNVGMTAEWVMPNNYKVKGKPTKRR